MLLVRLQAKAVIVTLVCSIQSYLAGDDALTVADVDAGADVDVDVDAGVIDHVVLPLMVSLLLELEEQMLGMEAGHTVFASKILRWSEASEDVHGPWGLASVTFDNAADGIVAHFGHFGHSNSAVVVEETMSCILRYMM